MALCTALGWSAASRADPRRQGAPTEEGLRIVTEELPPYNFGSASGAQGMTGLSTQVVQAVLQQLQLSVPIQSMPWARAYELARLNKDVLVYSIGRSAEREALFKWVGTIAPTDFYLFSHARHPVTLRRLEEARPYQVATVNEDIGEQFLEARGFVKGLNLQSSVRYEHNYDKLRRGRVDLWIMTELAARYIARRSGDDPDRALHKSLALPELGSAWYMAFGNKTSDAQVERFRAALDEVKRSGLYDQILQRWREGVEPAGALMAQGRGGRR
ncbi:transporter substrate-binding domain-containing protein [Mitsuaria sp. WAJ17]|nr:transporter substrate-binding domain-containing protein [Mitsuaria sp. WAJ17]